MNNLIVLLHRVDFLPEIGNPLAKPARLSVSICLEQARLRGAGRYWNFKNISEDLAPAICKGGTGMLCPNEEIILGDDIFESIS